MSTLSVRPLTRDWRVRWPPIAPRVAADDVTNCVTSHIVTTDVMSAAQCSARERDL